ncbi:MAG: XRE family transcriptional regulator [Methanoregula sp.]|nr:XRE family transcriptional regulator [Methanoregula sp.]
MAIGERIKSARINAGLSQDMLGKKLGVTKMAVSKYENGTITPNSGALIALSKALEVKIEYFFRTSAMHLSKPAYRCRKALSQKDETKILGKTADWLERYLVVEQITGSDKPLALPNPDSCRVSSLDQIEEVAVHVREEWNLGLNPIENLMDVLEQHGIKVGVIAAPVKFDALTMKYNDEHPLIIVNKTFSGDRQRLSLAHELGHMVLKLDDGIDEEEAAFRFAGAFLIPRQTAIMELGPKRKMLDFRELYVLKHKYGMSMGALIYRAKNLNIISEAAANRHWVEMRTHKWHLKEPGTQIEPEIPTHLELLLLRALTEHKISQSRFDELRGDDSPILAVPCQ